MSSYKLYKFIRLQSLTISLRLTVQLLFQNDCAPDVTMASSSLDLVQSLTKSLPYTWPD